MRGLTASTIARAVAVAMLAAGCARLADLGGGTEPAVAAPDGSAGPVTEGPTPKTAATIEISPTTLDYGVVACGSEAAPKVIKIRNTGARAVLYRAQFPDGAPFRIDGKLEGTLETDGTAELSVFAKPQLAGDNTLDFFVTAGEAVQLIHATARGSGPTFELAQSTIAFGDVRKENGGAAIDIDVKNTGVETISVPGFTSSNAAFDVQWAAKPGAFTIAPNASSTFKVALLSATTDDAAALTATIQPSTTTFCGAPPVLTVSGKRVTSEVTLNPADWGKQACNSTPTSKDIVITNYANAVVTYSLVIPTNSAFTVLSEGPHTVAAAPSATQPQTATIKVVPKKLGGTAPLADVKEVLGVILASTAPGVSGRRDVPLHVETRGAIITINLPAIAFTSNGTTTDSKSFKVQNAGNESMFLSWTFKQTSTTGTGAWTYSPPGYAPAGATVSGSVDFKATGGAGVSTATLTPSQRILLTVPSCKAVSPITLTGTKP